ncbi:RadC family protein [Pelobacter propionicus]|uniref:DNA repair protein RadC n=1 Tax=Pelobacter propionicus (strain DSM 2379 / NBRC 103807 / OttBd1) TaxID=338966 RepID=A0R7V6_PELPD|nr:DNA repair protein RadC [Pelobacter propionicus]ABL01328.1 DNA repair protein RadC [Pelobacter propionicus DSM 2379]
MPNLSLFDCNEQSTNTPATKRIVLKSIEARYRKEAVREDAPEWVTTRFTSPKQVFELFKDLIYETKEHFITLHLDGKNRIMCMDRVSIGSLNQSIVHPREVFKTALLSNAAAIICVHQHPSGDPNPSSEDLSITKRLKEAGEIMGIRVLDHIVVGHEDYISFVEKGLM